ncbi:hypothetical protein BOFE_05480 [Candidatus Borrelia fainii]|uniref:Rad50/SbcC-type AAA domain-containing protein n=1 Tax=Candidatus Borrelia fainii TaxID=2518322 RepID=A0ABN6URL6_9SPIR|nr:hypothetical protein BOFE_05480 [Candidatus Borrelia fainii]
MLVEFFVKNFVLVKELSIKLSKELITFIGEFGSGKSLLLTIYYLFGEKIKSNIITSEKQKYILLAKFRVNSDVKEYLFF